MVKVQADPLEAFCERVGVPLPFDAERIRAGRNSEVLLLRSRGERWILKHYYQHASDTRDRLGTEFAFLRFLQNCGVAEVPRPLGEDRTLGYGLYSYLPGARPAAIDSTHIKLAAGFVRAINQRRNAQDAQQLPNAADACFSWQDHLNLTELRLRRLLAAEATAPLEIEAQTFVREHLLACWNRLKGKVLREVDTGELTVPFGAETRIISPSDFGFHNTLENEGQLFFVDFEYAGWDDPTKLICDFICQPELPVTPRQGAQFSGELLINVPDHVGVERRVRHLLPLHRLKWCCIMLNEFRLEDRRRRSHAGVDPDGLLASQLGKARQYFDAHLASAH